jgi:TIR domain
MFRWLLHHKYQMVDALKLIIISHWSDAGERPEFWHLLVKDLQKSQVRLIPISSGSPLNEQWFWDEWDSRNSVEELDYWLYLYRRWRYHREDPDHLYDRWSREVRSVLQRIVGHNEVVAVIVFPCPEEEYRSYLKDLKYVLTKLTDVVVVQFRNGDSQPLLANRTRFDRVIWYPDDRQDLLYFLQRTVRGNDDSPVPVAFPVPAIDATPSTKMPFPTMEMRPPSEQSNKNSIHSIELLDEVYLGIATPPVISQRQSFVARFAAYTQENRDNIHEKLELEAPSSQQRLDLDICRWHRNTKVEIRLEVDGAKISNPLQSFLWNGTWNILRFDVKVNDDFDAQVLILKFDVAIEGLPIISIRPEIEVQTQGKAGIVASKESLIELQAPTSAFASYSTSDRQEVMSRVRSLQIFTGIDVFLDCLSLQPGDEWKPKLEREIRDRDVFWLFWSRNAQKSKWVDWEWRTALNLKTINKIQPHPLEPMEIAPPPKELSDLQFGTLYEWYTSELKSRWFLNSIRITRHRTNLQLQRLLKLIGSQSRLLKHLIVLAIIVVAPLTIILLFIHKQNNVAPNKTSLNQVMSREIPKAL